GVGVGMIMLKGASTGGSEIAAGLLQRAHEHLSVGRWILIVDATVVLLSAVVFGEVEAALYAGIQVFVCSVMIDHVVYAREEGRLLLVVTTKPQALCRLITEELSRGVTVLDAKGGYTGEGRSVLFCAVSRIQVPQFKRRIRQTDGDAFTMVVATQQVVGEGFVARER
ncbi:MAG: YitT family protein, partial [Clostridia bacterium]|nr:YitT family protein [Clostridia bacterium]